MIYVLDTSVVSTLMRGSTGITQWISRLGSTAQAITCPTVRGEVLFGVARLPEGKRKAALAADAEQAFRVFPTSAMPASAGEVYSQIKASCQAAGRPLDENDLWIAATAIALGATLATMDSDFDEVPGLSIVRYSPEI